MSYVIAGFLGMGVQEKVLHLKKKEKNFWFLQVIKEVFCWTREPMEVRRISGRKEAVLTEMLGDMQPLLAADVPKFMEGLASSKVVLHLPPITLA